MRILQSTAAIVAFLAAALAVADESPKVDPELESIQSVLDAYLATARHPDGKPLGRETIGKDVVAFWSNGKTIRGRPALRAACDAASAELRRDFEEFSATAGGVVIHRQGDLAWVTCRLRLAGKLTEERGDFERTTRSTFVFEKRGGKWRMVHEHSSKT